MVMSAPAFSIRILERYPHVTIIHHVEPDRTVWGSRNRRVLRKVADKWDEVFQFPFRPPRDLFEITRLSARASRADKCNLFVNSQGRVLGIRDGAVYAYRPNRGLEELFRIQGDTVLNRAMCEDSEGWSYFGEYFRNPHRGPVRIYRVAPELDLWEIAQEFHTGSIRHVHAVHRDPFDESALWVTVGDYEGECHLYRTNDRFDSMNKYGDGSQTFRAVNLLFTETHVSWITDSHLEQNRACRLERSSGKLEVGQKIPCSGWYATSTEDGLHVAFTTVEKGPAIQSDESSILVSQDGFQWDVAATFKKDFWRPFSVFKYGILSCPSGRLRSDDFYISGEGLVGLDGMSLRIRIQESTESTL